MISISFTFSYIARSHFSDTCNYDKNLFTDKTNVQINVGKEGEGGFGWLRGPRCFHNRGSSAQNFHITSDLTAQQQVERG